MSEQAPTRKRLVALDAFRGFDILAMLLVNVSWDRSAFPDWMFHRGWAEGRQGVTFTDLVFPWFLFIAGVCVPFSLTRGRGRDQSRGRRLWSAFRRGLLIYLCGGLLHAARTERVELLTWDILQLIGVAYFLCALLSELPRWVRLAFVAVVLGGKWWVLTRFVPPGAEGVVWTPEENGERWLAAHWGLGWFAGFKQALPATALCLLGAEIGRRILQREENLSGAARDLAVVGVITCGLAWLWSLDMPFSKDFFSSPYVLLSAGSGSLLLAAFLANFDKAPAVQASKRGAFRRALGWVLCVPGQNAIALYLFAELSWRMVLTRWRVAGPSGEPQVLINAGLAWLRAGFGPLAGAWLHALSWVLLGWLFCWQLHRRKIHLRL